MAKIRKKAIKINFKYFWGGFDPENNLFTNFLRKHYNVIISDNPDYLFYSVYPETNSSKDLSKKGDFIKKISPTLYVILKKIYSKIMNFSRKKRLAVPEGDFVKIFYASEHVKPDMNKCDWAFSSYFEEKIGNSRHMRLPIDRVGGYELENFGVPPLKKDINLKKIKKEKTRFCNFIYSQEVPERNDFFKKLNKYKKIDAPGRCMNNMPPISHKSPIESRLFQSWAKEKLNFLKRYKFTIAFENFSKPGWITEKLTQPMLVNSIPIYFGHSEVKRDFNTKSFLNYHDFKNMKEFIEYIIKVDNDDKLYEEILREPWYKNNQLSKDWDNSRLLKRFKEIFG